MKKAYQVEIFQDEDPNKVKALGNAWLKENSSRVDVQGKPEISATYAGGYDYVTTYVIHYIETFED